VPNAFLLLISLSPRHNPPVKVSVIVPAFNEEKLIAQSLRSIKSAQEAFTVRGWEAELVVCDNNSTDRTAELARAEGAVVAFEPVNQIARARNCGAAAATGDWFIFVDADSFPSRGLFDDVAEQIETGRCLGGGCLVKLDENLFWANVMIGVWNLISRLKRWAAGSFVYCEASAFRDLGGFSQKLYASEEIEFSQRLKILARSRNKKIVILRRHPLVTSARKLHLYSGREHLRFMWKAARNPGILTNRDECPTWYDGRR